MKIENRNKIDNNIESYPSGTLVRYYTNDENMSESFYGFIIKDVDGDKTVIFDLLDEVYYEDIHNYSVVEVFEKDKYKLVIE